MKTKKSKKFLEGIVKSAKMDKSCVVKVNRYKKNSLYLKSFRITQKYYIHDDKNIAKKGNRVVIEACRPYSAQKRWKLTRVVKDEK